MSKKTISLRLEEELYDSLAKRAKKNFLSVDEMAEDIVRRSMISYSDSGSKKGFKVDDRLVEVFSRDGRGRKRKKTKNG
jgi:hypothetical protein